MSVCRVLILVLATLSGWASAQVASFELQDLGWRLVGPFNGGRVTAVSGVTGQPNHFYFGAANGGVWESRDAGQSWQPIFDTQAIGTIGALAFAPSSPVVIYVGTGEARLDVDAAPGHGVYKSTDAGRTWSRTGLESTQAISRIIVDPANAQVVFVAALGYFNGPNAGRGVFRSLDGGASWQKILDNDEEVDAVDLAFEPRNASVVYAAMGRPAAAPAGDLAAGEKGSGLYKSIDGGDSWQPIHGNGFPETASGHIAIALAPTDPQRIYALVGGAAGGLYRSDDAADTWQRTSTDPRLFQREENQAQLRVDPKNADRVYVLNSRMLRSEDSGGRFTSMAIAATGNSFHDLWIDPADPAIRILATDQGAVISVNGGNTWSDSHNQPTARIWHIATDQRFPYRVYAMQSGRGLIGLPSRSNNPSGVTPDQAQMLAAGNGFGTIAPDPRNADIIYAGTVNRLDLRTQQVRAVGPAAIAADLELHERISPLSFDGVDSALLYFGTRKIWRSSDGGELWEAISPDLARTTPVEGPDATDAEAKDGSDIHAHEVFVNALATSPRDAGLIWAATTDGGVWRRDTAADDWEEVTPHELTEALAINSVTASHFDVASAYVAADQHPRADRQPSIYRTRDGGKSWQLIVEGIRGDDVVNVIREDPQRRGLLFAGSERGVHVSFDDGDHWQELQQNLPRTSVRDLAVHGNDLVIGTWGRGIWIMDDISALRQMSATDAPRTRLYKPATGVRYRMARPSGAPWANEVAGSNPPAGAVIDYMIAGETHGPVQLAIFDADGGIVRRYSSADRPDTTNGGGAEAGSTPQPSSILSTTLGMHRFTWSMHYPPAAFTRQTSPYADGAWAPPGQYTIELDVDGTQYTQTLTLVPDPRVEIPASAYVAEFELTRRVESREADVAEAMDAASALRALLRERLNTADAKSAELLGAYIAQLDELIGVPPGVVPAAARPAPTSARWNLALLARALERLHVAVDGADAAPSADAVAGYAKLALLVDSSVRHWSTLKSVELAALNDKLVASGAQPVHLPGRR